MKKDLITQIQYLLDTPVKYAKDGKMEEGIDLIIKAPSPKNLFDVTIIEQQFYQAMLKANESFAGLAEKAKNVQKDEKTVSDGSGVFMILLTGNANIETCFNSLERILLAGGCSVEGERVTKIMWDEISIKDKKNILGLYVENFILGSLNA